MFGQPRKVSPFDWDEDNRTTWTYFYTDIPGREGFVWGHFHKTKRVRRTKRHPGYPPRWCVTIQYAGDGSASASTWPRPVSPEPSKRTT